MCTTLSEVNDQFTEEMLINILSKKNNGKKVQLTDWNFHEASNKGDNYLSRIYKGKVSGVIDGNPKQHVEANIVVKSMPRNSELKKSLRCDEFFYNEIIFYTEIASRFENFLAEKEQSDLLCIPHYIISSTDSENGFLVLEDGSSLGFRRVSRQNVFDWAECIAVLKTLSRFHAISFAYKDQRKEEFAKMTNSLKETLFGHWDWYKGYHEKVQVLIKDVLAIECPNSKAEKRYNSYKFGALYEKCAEFCKRKDAPTSVIIEGDCWPPNFLIRDIGQNQKQALMLDFQIARCASPILDLSFLIYSCTLKSFRDQHFDDVLKIYHSELSDTIKLLGSDPEKIYPWDQFMKEVQEQFGFGVFAALEAIPLTLIDVPESFSIETVVEDNNAVDCGDLVSFSTIKTANDRQRISDVIVHAVEKGYI
ncbi:hypothetical protein P5V15_006104 [Pogonomyrmex californicus]